MKFYLIPAPAGGEDDSHPETGLNGHSGVRLPIPEPEKCTGYPEWVDVCKQPVME